MLAAAAFLLLALAMPAVGSFHETTGAVPDRVFPLLLSGTSFNGLSAPDAPLLEAYLGETTRFVTVATEPHTFHLHGHPWLVEGRIVDTFLVDADTPHAFDVRAGGVDHHAGDWMYHCHFDAHMGAGMWGIFRVYPFSASLAFSDAGTGSGTGTGTGMGSAALMATLHRMGEPLDGAALELSAGGVVLPAHVEPLGDGRYAVHAPLPATGELALTATHPERGVSVARLALGGGTLAPQVIAAGTGHAHPS